MAMQRLDGLANRQASRWVGDTPSKVAYLSDCLNYPDAPASISVIQTHFAWLFLTGDFVYKFKKPKKSNSFDFTTLAARKRNCEIEIQLNRRLTSGVYIGTVSLNLDDDQILHLDGPGQPIEWLVKMRQLPTERMLGNAIKLGTARPSDADRIVTKLVRFYESTSASRLTGRQFRDKLKDQIDQYRHELLRPAFKSDTQLVETITAAQLDYLQQHPAILDSRVAQKKVRDVHGDLKPEHICLGPDPQIIDCLEFDRDLRTMDCLEEIAFLALECERLDARWFGAEILQKYQLVSGDRPDIGLTRFYLAQRAAVRAMLAVWHIQDEATTNIDHWIGMARRYLDQAHRIQTEKPPLLA